MYVPAHFSETDGTALHALIEQYPFGTLVTHGADGLDANHLPFHLEVDASGRTKLHAHVARANPLWQSVSTGDMVLAVFQAGDAYVSPNWYPSKHATHQQVPTWNYRVVHAHGRITIRDDVRYVRGVVAHLTRRHEAAQPRPWKMGDAPAAYLEEMLKAIVGIEIDVTRLVGKLKLSQNKSAEDVRGAAEALKGGEALKTAGNGVIGEAMLKSMPENMPSSGNTEVSDPSST